MASTNKIAALKRKVADYRLFLEMAVAAYVALNPQLSYRQIGEQIGYPASRICEIAKKYGKNRSAKIVNADKI